MVCLTVVIALFAVQTTPAYAASRAGEVKSLRGSAVAKGTDGRERELTRGDEILSGDRIDTAARSFVLVQFDDSTRFALGQNGSMNVSDFAYKNPNKPDSIATQVLKGAFRFVSGLISKRRPSAMRVRLGVIATIGLRGTSVGGEVIGDSATVMLLDPETGEASGIDVSNDFGSVSIDEPGFGTEIADANSAPSAPRRMRLRTIQNLMRTMQSVGRVSVPRPRPHMR
jgi:hypothetical protein